MNKYIEEVAVGSTGRNREGDEYVITSFPNGNKKEVVIRFIETGYEMNTWSSNLYKGRVKDRYKITVCGFGILGDKRDYKDEHYYKIHTHWTGMIQRCYNTNDKQYCNYGGDGVTVCERWRYFNNFYDDFRKLDGYSEEIMQLKSFRHLDKDIKQDGIPHNQRVYSLETCCLVTKEENEKFKRMKPRPYIKVVNPAGTQFYINNASEFSREVNYAIRNKYINYCLSGKCEYHLGWTFEYTTKEEYDKFHRDNPDTPEYPAEEDLVFIPTKRYEYRLREGTVIYDPSIHKARYNQVV